MANDSSPSLFSNPLPLVAMALLAAGIVVRTIPLESARPGDADRAQPSIADTQDVPARLWQDPFAAVNAGKRALSKEQLDATASLRQPAALRKQIERFKRRGDTPVQILGVMTSTSAFAEDAEVRRRSRYAVVQGLSARGYTPFDPEALGYVDIDKAQERGLPAQVPFEWFVPENFGKSNEQPPILLLWLEENVLGWRPAPRIARLIQAICSSQEDSKGSSGKSGNEKNGKHRGQEKSDIRKDGYALNGPMCEEDLLQKELSFIGPGTSYGLMMLTRHIDPEHWNDLRGPVQRDPEWPTLVNYRFNFFSPFATNPSAELDKLLEPPEKSDAKVSAGVDKSKVETQDLRACIFPHDKDLPQIDCPIRIIRTIGGDDELARLTSAELALRGVNGNLWECNDRVVIVAERDTSYGRELALQFRKELELAPACVNEKDAKNRKNFVWEVGYLRGLDGAVAETNPEKSDAKRRASSGTQKIDIEALDAPTALRERAEGRSQFDYVRRLAQQIRDHEQAEDFGSGPLDFARLEGAPKIKAIGVLGNDVYDKLLILQALHAVFPYAIFFTTDLDARLLHGDQSEWTRNLVVASNYGFSLRRGLQRATPPFRNGYQTSAYLATLLAVEGMTKELDEKTLNQQLEKWRHPLVYELGRTREVPLSDPTKDDGSGNTNASNSNASSDADAKDCDPRKVLECERINAQSVPPAHSAGLALSTFAAGLMLLLMSSQYVVRKVERNFGWAMFCIGSVAIVIVIVVGRWLRPLTDNLQEPFFWFEGVSLWPSLFALSAAFTTACISAVYIGIALCRAKEKIANDFFPSVEGHPDSRGVAAWRTYNKNTSRVVRAKRVLPIAAVCFVFFLLLILLGKQHLPFRGELAWICAVVAFSFAGLALLYLVFQVVDIVKCTTQLLKWLTSADTNYPDTVRRRYSTELGLTDSCESVSTRERTQVLENWIDFRLVVQLTTEVERFIYFPFLVLLLFALAQIRLFDDWQISPSILVVVAIFVTYVLYCSYSLRRAAEGERARALDHYNACLLRSASGEEAVCGPVPLIETLVTRIRETRAGAFRPFFQRPALQSLLIPFGGMGGYSIVEYFFMRGV